MASADAEQTQLFPLTLKRVQAEIVIALVAPTLMLLPFILPCAIPAKTMPFAAALELISLSDTFVCVREPEVTSNNIPGPAPDTLFAVMSICVNVAATICTQIPCCFELFTTTLQLTFRKARSVYLNRSAGTVANRMQYGIAEDIHRSRSRR